MDRPPLEVADVIRAAGPGFAERNQRWLTSRHRKVLTAIESCRTAALGGHVDECSNCGYRAISYNSCLMGSVFFWGVGAVRSAESRHSLMISTAATHHKLKALCYVGLAVYGHVQQGERILETYFSAPKTLRRLRGGISGPDSY